MATITDIAKKAGVSTTTVSHVINNTRYVSPELKEKVMAAIRSAGAPPKSFMRKQAQMKQGEEKPYILVLLSDVDSFFERETCRHMLRIAQATSLSLIPMYYSDFCGMTGGGETLGSIARLLSIDDRFAGAIFFSDDSDVWLEEMAKSVNIPMVVIGKVKDGINADFVCLDTFGGAFRAARHLIRYGHERIAFLGGKRTSNELRIEGYRKALADHGIAFDPGLICNGLTDQTQIYRALDELFAREAKPTAVLAANYTISIPLFRYLNENNISCPDDISVVCFSEFKWADLHSPTITTVAQDPGSVASTAMDLMSSRLKSGGAGMAGGYRHVEISSKLILRNSTHGIVLGPFGERGERPEVLNLTPDEFRELSRHNYTAMVFLIDADSLWNDLTYRGIRETLNMAGISIIGFHNANYNADIQNKQLKASQLLDPDIVIGCPADNKKNGEGFKPIAQSKAKLVMFANIPEGMTNQDYVTCVCVNEQMHGRNIGIGLCEYMTKHGLENVGMLQIDMNFYAIQQRDKAAEQVIAEEYPLLKLCGISVFKAVDEAYEKTKELLTNHPEIEGLYVPWDTVALEAIRALTDIGRFDIAIAVGDLSFTCAMNMAKGGMIKMISAQTPYEQGVATALAACNALLGKKTPKFVPIDPISVTNSNLLTSWKAITREEAPQPLQLTLKQNQDYLVGN